MPNLLEQVECLLTDIREKVNKVHAEHFCFVVAGESISEKFTFINAYLGIKLLPMDIKQSTGAAVEIKYGEEFFVRATYADEHENEIKEDEASRKFLKNNTALDDEYRDIPVPIINKEILIKTGLRAKANSKTITVSKIDVEVLLNATEIQEANIQNMPISEYNEKICTYVKNEKYHWVDIVTKIEIFFPFTDEMRGIEIMMTESDAIMEVKVTTKQSQLISQLCSKISFAKSEAEKNKSCYGCSYKWRYQGC